MLSKYSNNITHIDIKYINIVSSPELGKCLHLFKGCFKLKAWVNENENHFEAPTGGIENERTYPYPLGYITHFYNALCKHE